MNLPNHVAIIMDGNGRWGLKKKNSRNYGHQKGIETVETIIKESIKKNIKFLTLFAFSTENWKRPKSEVNFLFKLLSIYIDKETDKFVKENIKICIIGDTKKFPLALRKKLKKIEKATYKNNLIQVNIALNYGSRQEIVNSTRQILKHSLTINIKNINKFLYTKNIPDPEIIIRTGNKQRISNFLMWQCIYSEIFFEKKLWPDFNKNDFRKIITKFSKINRNFGGLNERIE